MLAAQIAAEERIGTKMRMAAHMARSEEDDAWNALMAFATPTEVA